MDLSALIVVIVMAGSFFGFIVWMAIQSRRDGSEMISSKTVETGLRNE